MKVGLAQKLIDSWNNAPSIRDLSPKPSIPEWMFELPGKVEIANKVLADHGFPHIQFELGGEVYPPAALSGRINKSQKAEFETAVQDAVSQSGLTNATGNWELATFYFGNHGQELSIDSVVM